MRLRLRIERNELPPTQILHSIPPTQTSQTISQFLQQINVLFPLESTNWDISDYAVLVGGYEATHYTEVGQAFKDEDEVVIKPLGFAELRARTIAGRDQISEDGRHLLDGIPFGRPMLKRPRRPEVQIPARKRQRVDDGEPAPLETSQMVTTAEDEEDDDSEDDEDFEDAEEDGESDSESDEEVAEEAVKSNTKKPVKLVPKEVDDDSSDTSSDSSDEDSDSSDSDSSDEDSSSDDSSSSSSDSESEASWDGVDEQVTITTDSAPAKVAKAAAKFASPPEKKGLPNQGDARTKERNNRRRDSKKLKHLKEAGTLPQTATLQDLHNWQQGLGLDDDGVKAVTQQAKMEQERKKLLDQIASGGVEITNGHTAGTGDGDDDGPPEEQSSRPNGALSGAMELDSSDAASTQIIAETQQAAGAVTQQDSERTYTPSVSTTQIAEAEADQTPAAKRARLDTKSMSRLVFGSLGLRTPKTQEERDALQKKLAARPKRAAPAPAATDVAPDTTAVEEQDPESWRDKIVLTAVECVDEDVSLTAPPFPFQQRWDPQYQTTKKRKRSRGRKSGDIESYDRTAEQLESARPDKYNKSTGSDALDYDDPEDDEDDDEYWEEGALLGNGDGAAEDAEKGDFFPDLPTELSTLPTLSAADAKTGDFITYQELSVSAATGWQPKVITQVAHIETVDGDGSWTIMLKQDKPKEYNEDGTRIYSKFEMENFSDDGNDDATKTVTFAELQDPRLLSRPVFDLESS